MRRLEYSNKIKENNLKKKYNNKIGYIIFIQKMARGYLVRKVIYQVGVINESLKKFFFIIKLYVQKKYFYIFRYNISQIWVKNDIDKVTNNSARSSGAVVCSYKRNLTDIVSYKIERKYSFLERR